MSHVDAETALAIYRHFGKQAEHAVEFLGVAKKLQNILDVPIPDLNLKHVMYPPFRLRNLTNSLSAGSGYSRGVPGGIFERSKFRAEQDRVQGSQRCCG